VLHKSLDNFYITYELNAYTDVPQRMMKTYSNSISASWMRSMSMACR
jgi:hypothetical protein